MANYYITNYGSDDNNGLSLSTPWKSLTMLNTILSHYNYFYIDGYFNDLQYVNINYVRYINGLNNAKIDGNNIYHSNYIRCILSDLEIFNYDRFCGYISSAVTNCYFHDITRLYGTYPSTLSYFKNCIFKNVKYVSLATYTMYSNNTFFNCQYVALGNHDKVNHIFCNSSIDMFNKIRMLNCLFINCSFKFRGGELGLDETEFTYPNGTSGDEKLQDLRDRMVNVYGEIETDYLIDCIYYNGDYNDIFIDADSGDFHLVSGCVAEHMSYMYGNYIGAKSAGITSNINSSTLINIGTSGYILDQLQDSLYESEILDIGFVKKITNLNILESFSPYNGIQINYNSNLNSYISQGTNGLINGETYAVLSDNIVLNNQNEDYYTTWHTFVANYEIPIEGVSGDGLDFSKYCFEYGTYGTCGTDGGFGVTINEQCGTDGLVQHIIYENDIKKIKIKVSKTNPLLNDSTELLMKILEEPMVNVNILGEPIIGNADLNFDENTAVSLYTRYIKFIINIKSNNLAIR